MSNGGDPFSVVSEVNDHLTQTIHHLFEGGKNLIAKAFLPEFIPNHFDGVQLGGIKEVTGTVQYSGRQRIRFSRNEKRVLCNPGEAERTKREEKAEKLNRMSRLPLP